MCIKLSIPSMEILKLPELPIQATCSSHYISSYSNSVYQFSFYKFIKEWNALMHGSILPVTIPPRATRGKVQPFSPGGGELFEAVLSRGGGGKSNITSCSCEVRHFSVDAGPRGEDCLYPVRISRIYSRLAIEE